MFVCFKILEKKVNPNKLATLHSRLLDRIHTHTHRNNRIYYTIHTLYTIRSDQNQSNSSNSVHGTKEDIHSLIQQATYKCTRRKTTFYATVYSVNSTRTHTNIQTSPRLPSPPLPPNTNSFHSFVCSFLECIPEKKRKGRKEESTPPSSYTYIEQQQVSR